MQSLDGSAILLRLLIGAVRLGRYTCCLVSSTLHGADSIRRPPLQRDIIEFFRTPAGVFESSGHDRRSLVDDVSVDDTPCQRDQHLLLRELAVVQSFRWLRTVPLSSARLYRGELCLCLAVCCPARPVLPP